MKDELRKYVDKNREAFDIYNTDFNSVWEGIEDALDKQSRPGILTWTMRIAASLLIIMAVGIAFFIGQQTVSVKNNGLALHQISPEMADTEAFYQGQINEKLSLISHSEAQFDDQVFAALRQLDDDYEELRKDMLENTDTEEVIDAMISYYRLKLQMLEQILDEMKKKDEIQDASTQL